MVWLNSAADVCSEWSIKPKKAVKKNEQYLYCSFHIRVFFLFVFFLYLKVDFYSLLKILTNLFSENNCIDLIEQI